MKKILFVMAALFGCFASSRAQSTLVATLSHGNDVSIFPMEPSRLQILQRPSHCGVLVLTPQNQPTSSINSLLISLPTMVTALRWRVSDAMIGCT